MLLFQGTYDDYLEIFIQFGYVFLFSAVYPMAALWALINNVIETRVDAFKLCRFLQRPFAHRVKDTGAWQVKLILHIIYKTVDVLYQTEPDTGYRI